LFALLKVVHMSCAFASLAGFTLRGYWLLTEHPLLQQRLTKTLPHVVDTLLLGSAIGMLLIWKVSPLETPWLTAKVLALLMYIALGMIALRFGKTKTVRLCAWSGAMLSVAYIISVAFTKSPLGPFELIFAS
jgi:uncharacterized membrane protein SirB2